MSVARDRSNRNELVTAGDQWVKCTMNKYICNGVRIHPKAPILQMVGVSIGVPNNCYNYVRTDGTQDDDEERETYYVMEWFGCKDLIEWFGCKCKSSCV